MKKFLAGTALATLALCLALPAFAQAPLFMYRENLKWRSSNAATVGGLLDADVATHATGASSVDTSRCVDMRCIWPRNGITSTDSTLYVRVVLHPRGDTHSIAVAPTVAVQFMATPTSGVLAATSTLAVTAGLGGWGGFVDSTYYRTYTYTTMKGVTGGLGGAAEMSWMRVLVTSSFIGSWEGWVEYWTSCPTIINDNKFPR